ncbi:MAG: class I SAM-dependent methyltransferase [Methylomonas sp.]|jgi:SAM-dependent methyltransferase
MEERVIYESCPLCESEIISLYKVADCSNHPLYNTKLKSAITWNKCSDCGHVFTEGFYTDEACNLIFSKTNDNQRVGANLEQNRLVSSKMIEKVLPFVSDGYWLDVGFGNGSLLFTAREYGFNPIGTDLRIDNVAIINQLGIQAYNKNITELMLEEKCSVISMADVLEHIPYPKESLVAANNLLKHGGVLLVSMPNSENVIWEVMNNQNINPYWGEIEHYHNFSRTRLYSLLSEFGFVPKRYGISERYRVSMEVVAQKI